MNKRTPIHVTLMSIVPKTLTYLYVPVVVDIEERLRILRRAPLTTLQGMNRNNPMNTGCGRVPRERAFVIQTNPAHVLGIFHGRREPSSILSLLQGWGGGLDGSGTRRSEGEALRTLVRMQDLTLILLTTSSYMDTRTRSCK